MKIGQNENNIPIWDLVNLYIQVGHNITIKPFLVGFCTYFAYNYWFCVPNPGILCKEFTYSNSFVLLLLSTNVIRYHLLEVDLS